MAASAKAAAIEHIRNLSKAEFLELVANRLNIPAGAMTGDREILTDNDIDRWTEECLIDELFIKLAQTKQIVITNDGKQIEISKYYHQAKELRYKIPIHRPVPKFIINISDLDARLIAEIITLEDPTYVLKQAVGRIFENVDSRQYHLSIASKLKVRLSK
jgi:hypothetical protein